MRAVLHLPRCVANPTPLTSTNYLCSQVDPTQAGLVDGLAVIMAQLVGGGGAAKVNIDKITDELSELGKQYPFQVSYSQETDG